MRDARIGFAGFAFAGVQEDGQRDLAEASQAKLAGLFPKNHELCRGNIEGPIVHFPSNIFYRPRHFRDWRGDNALEHAFSLAACVRKRARSAASLLRPAGGVPIIDFE